MAYNTYYRIEFRDPFSADLFATNRAVADACRNAGVALPKDVFDFFSQPIYRLALAIVPHKSSEAAFALGVNLGGGEVCAWYRHEQDLARASASVPNVQFTLHGAGEDHGDRWRKYFVGGKVQEARATITYAPFDERLLRDPEHAD